MKTLTMCFVSMFGGVAINLATDTWWACLPFNFILVAFWNDIWDATARIMGKV